MTGNSQHYLNVMYFIVFFKDKTVKYLDFLHNKVTAKSKLMYVDDVQGSLVTSKDLP